MHSAGQASILAARQANVYVGIFGEEYSEDTEKEFDEALSKLKPCLIYIKDVKQRDSRLENLLHNKIRPEFKMHVFKTETELYEMILRNLNEHLLELLLLGLDKYKEGRSQTIKVAEQNTELIAHAVRSKEISFPNQRMQIASQHFKLGDHLSAVANASMALEAWLTMEIEKKTKMRPMNMSMGHLLDEAVKHKIITTYESNRLTQVRHVRNSVFHGAKIPTSEESEFVIRLTSELLGMVDSSYDFDLDRFSEKGKEYVGIHNGNKSIDTCWILSENKVCRWWDNDSDQPRTIASGGGGKCNC
jgi:hypothetical protein